MGKIFRTILCISAFCLNANAQNIKFGIHAGIVTSGLIGGDKYQIYDRENKLGFEVGGDVKYNIYHGINLTSGINIFQYGGKFSVMSPYVNNMGQSVTDFPEVNTNVISFEVPLKFGIDLKFSNALVLTPNIGTYFRYAISSVQDDVISNGNTSEKWNCLKDYNNGAYHLDALKRFDIGLQLGVDATLSNHYVIGFNYKHAMSESSKQFGLKSHSFGMTFGYCF